jgi:cytolethal distending toxin subunit B
VILTTWNMQGGDAATEAKWEKGVANMIAKPLVPPDAICLQEAGGVPDSAWLRATVPFSDPFGNATSVSVWNWDGTGRYSTWRPERTIVYHHWDTAGSHANTAVVTRSNLPKPANVALVWGNVGTVWRPAVGALVRGEWIFSFHAISQGGADASLLLAQVAAFSAGIPWRVGGDFNREPATLRAGLLPANSVVCPPDAPTHPARHPTNRYDYFVCDGNTAETGLVDKSICLSDHWAVDFAF